MKKVLIAVVVLLALCVCCIGVIVGGVYLATNEIAKQATEVNTKVISSACTTAYGDQSFDESMFTTEFKDAYTPEETATMLKALFPDQTKCASTLPTSPLDIFSKGFNLNYSATDSTLTIQFPGSGTIKKEIILVNTAGSWKIHYLNDGQKELAVPALPAK
jgi:hypothetical protein